MARRIGDVVSDIEFSVEEKYRISESFRTCTGAPYAILTKHCADIRDQDFWHATHKILKINGYRPGKAKDQILKKCLDSVNNQDSRENVILWRLYRRCVVHHMNTDLEKLNSLLSSEEFGENLPSSTESIFKEIVRLASLYGVPPGDIRTFYEIWGFPRISDFDNLLSTPTNDLEIVKRLIYQESQSLESKLKKTMETSLGDLPTRMSKISGSLERVQSDIGSLSGKLDNSISVVRTEMQNFTATAVAQKFEEVSVGLKKSLAAAPKATIQTVPAEEILKLSDRMNSLSNRLAIVEQQRSAQIVPQQQNSRPQVAPANTVDLIRQWATSLRAYGCTQPEIQLLATIAAFKASPILIANHFDHINPLIQNLYTEEEVRLIVASPLWTTPSDWQGDLSFLTENHSKHRLLILCDFEVPLQEAYLMPALVKWSTQNQNTNDKIILIQSSAANPVSNRLFEFGIQIPKIDHEFPESLSSKANNLIDAPAIAKLLTNGLGLLPRTDGNVNHENSIRQLAKNSDLAIHPSVLTTFSRLQNFFEMVLTNEAAFDLALSLSVLRWIEKTAGAIRMQIFEERIYAILEAGGVNG